MLQICRCCAFNEIVFFCIYATFLSKTFLICPGQIVFCCIISCTPDSGYGKSHNDYSGKTRKNTLFGRLYNKNSPRTSLYFNSNSIYCCLFLLLICVRLLYLVDLTSLSELHFQRTNSRARRILT